MFHWFKRKKTVQCDSSDPLEPNVASSAQTLEASARIEAEARTHGHSLPKTLSEVEALKLQIQVRHELEERLRPEVEAVIKAGHQRELHEAKQRMLLNYLVSESGQDVENFYARLPANLRNELDSAMRRHLTPQVERALRRELRERIRSEETLRHQEQIRSKALDAPQGLSESRHALSQAMKQEVEAELREELKPAVEEQLIKEMRLPLLINESGQNEGTVAAALKHHMNVCIDQIRESIHTATWLQVSTAIFEAFGAAGTLDDDVLDDAMRAGQDAFDAAIVGVDDHERLRLAIEAALTSLGFGSHCWSEHWKWYCSRAKSLIDRRLFTRANSVERELHPPDGFFRATQHYTCGRTGRRIETGECYLLFGGLRIGLPLTAQAASELIAESQARNPKDSASAQPTPWEAWPTASDAPFTPKSARQNS